MNTYNPMIIHYVNDMDRAYAFYNETLGLAPDTRSEGREPFVLSLRQV